MFINLLRNTLLTSPCSYSNREVRLTPKQVNNEVRLLESFAGEDETCALESIKFISDYEFDNGCRAPPWRQVHGDICYLKIKPLDADMLSITANTAGVYRNKVGVLLVLAISVSCGLSFSQVKVIVNVRPVWEAVSESNSNWCRNGLIHNWNTFSARQ